MAGYNDSRQDMEFDCCLYLVKNYQHNHKELMKTITKLDLRMEEIYNADESGLYWKMLPEKTYAASFEKSAGKESRRNNE
ncbi:unnamed protein product [Acanthoscelides obtectus]|uniref:Uncharacterized protein n=1 Tax=Acanthoscelides obtectus TaxID=200917 RepID=A0A9P0LPA5_ACAOB|nr:unnamed protein product [Acanthoscelides obtectus]CAK1635816.1 hypothetical protein AOBTE_LOCUS9532 [Acanthoscelides obtectus]